MAIGHISFQVPKLVIPKAFLRPFRCAEVLVGVGVVLEVWCKSCCGGKFPVCWSGVFFFGVRFLGEDFWRGENPFFQKNLVWIHEFYNGSVQFFTRFFRSSICFIGVWLGWGLKSENCWQTWDAPKANLLRCSQGTEMMCWKHQKKSRNTPETTFFLRFEAFSGDGRCLKRRTLWEKKQPPLPVQNKHVVLTSSILHVARYLTWHLTCCRCSKKRTQLRSFLPCWRCDVYQDVSSRFDCFFCSSGSCIAVSLFFEGIWKMQQLIPSRLKRGIQLKCFNIKSKHNEPEKFHTSRSTCQICQPVLLLQIGQNPKKKKLSSSQASIFLGGNFAVIVLGREYFHRRHGPQTVPNFTEWQTQSKRLKAKFYWKQLASTQWIPTVRRFGLPKKTQGEIQPTKTYPVQR